MSSKAMSLKGRIDRYAKQKNIAAQVVLQNYMFECFLERLSKSEYQEKFVIKGGILVAAIVGLESCLFRRIRPVIRPHSASHSVHIRPPNPVGFGHLVKWFQFNKNYYYSEN